MASRRHRTNLENMGKIGTQDRSFLATNRNQNYDAEQKTARLIPILIIVPGRF